MNMKQSDNKSIYFPYFFKHNYYVPICIVCCQKGYLNCTSKLNICTKKQHLFIENVRKSFVMSDFPLIIFVLSNYH